MLGHLRGEGADLRCLGTLRPVHVEWQPDDEPLGVVGREAFGQRLEVALSPAPLHHTDPLRRDPELVTHGDPDARIAHIERSDAHETRLAVPLK